MAPDAIKILSYFSLLRYFAAFLFWSAKCRDFRKIQAPTIVTFFVDSSISGAHFVTPSPDVFECSLPSAFCWSEKILSSVFSGSLLLFYYDQGRRDIPKTFREL